MAAIVHSNTHTHYPKIDVDEEDLDLQFIYDCDKLGNFPFDREEYTVFQRENIQISRELVDDFLDEICSIIDVDSARAKAHGFTDYTTMCQWLLSEYNGAVFAKFDHQYQRIGRDLDRLVIDYWVREMPEIGREMRRTVPIHFKNFLYAQAMTSCWWSELVGSFLEADEADDCDCLDSSSQKCFYEAYLEAEFGGADSGTDSGADSDIEDSETENGVEDDADDAQWS